VGSTNNVFQNLRFAFLSVKTAPPSFMWLFQLRLREKMT
jgi:hypothetical protein